MSHKETADDYDRVLIASGRYRIIRCKDDIQFIIQRRRPNGGPSGGGEFPWKPLAYVMLKRELPMVLERPSLGIPAGDLAVLLAGLSETQTQS